MSETGTDLLLSDLETETFRLQQAMAAFAAVRWTMHEDEKLCLTGTMCTVEHDLLRKDMFAVRRNLRSTVKHCLTECLPSMDLASLPQSTVEERTRLRKVALCYRGCVVPTTHRAKAESKRLKQSLIALNRKYFPGKAAPPRIETFF